MALSGSIHGSSSLKTTSDKYKISQNFDNEEFSSDFEAYMSTNIGRGQMKNYDNFYINGLYSNMNVAKTSYHIKGKGKTAIFAICRGVENTDGCFDASRKVMEYLDEQRENILNAKSLLGIEKNLADFTKSCNNMLLRDSIEEAHKVSMIVVVYAFSGVIFMNSGNCSLIQINKKGRCKLLTEITDALGAKQEHNFTIKKVKSLLTSHLMMYSDSVDDAEQKNLNEQLLNKTTLKERMTEMISRAMNKNFDKNCTCIMVDENSERAIMPSTKWVAVVCMAIAAISAVNMVIQLCLNI